jgi:hypothetical protein
MPCRTGRHIKKIGNPTHSIDCFCNEVETEKEGGYGTDCQCMKIITEDGEAKSILENAVMVDISKGKLEEVI